MTLIQFIVVKRKGNWMVKFSDQERSFSAQQDAVLAAIELANECGKDGRPSVVLLQTAKNQFDAIWTYGENPFPPSKSDVPSLSRA
jgi:hypothetical protein